MTKNYLAPTRLAAALLCLIASAAACTKPSPDAPGVGEQPEQHPEQNPATLPTTSAAKPPSDEEPQTRGTTRPTSLPQADAGTGDAGDAAAR